MKLTKNELRDRQRKLTQLERYLPTLKLKKAMLQSCVSQAEQEIAELRAAAAEVEQRVRAFQSLFSQSAARDLIASVHIESLKTGSENIAGVEIPTFESIAFSTPSFLRFDRPLWLDSAILITRSLVEAKERVGIAEQKKGALEKELREVSIRVNLFEKVMIPRTRAEVKKIRLFLSDQELSAVAMSKVAKQKIEKRKAS